MFEWARVKIGFDISTRANPKFSIIDKNFAVINFFNRHYCSFILGRGDLRNCRDQYNGILFFIFGNFMYNIDIVLEEFLNENKSKNFISALEENQYAEEHFEERKRILCYDKIRNLILHIAKYEEFPLDSNGLIHPDQVTKINQYLHQKPAIQSEYIQGSIFCFLFRTLDFALQVLREGEYKFSDYYKTELFRYVRDKDWEWSDNYYVWVNVQPQLFKRKTIVYEATTNITKNAVTFCNTLADLEEWERPELDKLQKDEVYVQYNDCSTLADFDDKENKELDYLQNEGRARIAIMTERIGVKYKRLLPFSVNEAATTFLEELDKDKETEAKLYIRQYESSVSKNIIFQIGDNSKFDPNNIEVRSIYYTEWQARSI